MPDEESEDVDARSIDELVEHGLRGDFAITGEPTDLHIGVQAKGVLAVRVAVSGTAAHGSTPWLGDNAILKAHDVFRRIETLPFSRMSSDLFDRPSINLARIVGGDAFNKVPDTCAMDVDIRYLPNQDPARSSPRSARSPTSRSCKLLHARAGASSRATTPTCWRCATRSARAVEGDALSIGRDGASDAVSFLEAASRPSSSAPSAVATTARTSGCRSPRSRATATRWATSSRELPAWLDRQEQPRCGPSRAAWPEPRRRIAPNRRVPAVERDVPRRDRLASAAAAHPLLIAAVLVVSHRGDRRRACSRSSSRADVGTQGTRSPNISARWTTSRAAGRRRCSCSAPTGATSTGSAATRARSDTMMLVRLDPDKTATAVMSIPRDLRSRSPATVPTRSTPPTRSAARARRQDDQGASGHRRSTHVVNVNFGGFRDAVDRLGCVYVDVDRKYYHRNVGLAHGQQYAAINIRPGYQKLCGQDALDYVRFRHDDSDLVRAARQQDFLRQAKDAGRARASLFGDRDELLTHLRRANTRHATSTRRQGDPAAAQARLRVLQHPIREVQFRGDAGPEYVTVTQANLKKSLDAFLNVKATGKKREVGRADNATKKKKRKVRTSPGLPPGMVNDHRQAEDHVAKASARLSFPLYFPSARLSKGSYVGDGPRVYDIYDRGHRRHRAYRMVVSAGLFGQYYGVQGTNGRRPRSSTTRPRR